MELKLIRKWKKSNYCIGNLYINGKFFCNTCEDVDRGLTDIMSISEIKRIKVAHETAIPIGKYNITLDVVSPRFGSKEFYKKYANGGRVPRLLDVKGFDGVLIHTGNTAIDSSGCILVGDNKAVGKVINSQETFKRLYSILLDSRKKGEKITIEIV